MKNLCLDIGNVICRLDFDNFTRPLSMKLNLSKEEVFNFMNRVQKYQDLGFASLAEELQYHFKIKSEATIEDLLFAWNQILVPNYELINSVNKFVLDNKIELAILSNIGPEHMNKFLKSTNVVAAAHHFSCEVGARKPSLIYYQSFLQMHPQFKDALYIDDNKQNLIAGNKMGLRTRYFDLNNYTAVMDDISSIALMNIIQESIQDKT